MKNNDKLCNEIIDSSLQRYIVRQNVDLLCAYLCVYDRKRDDGRCVKQAAIAFRRCVKQAAVAFRRCFDFYNSNL